MLNIYYYVRFTIEKFLIQECSAAFLLRSMLPSSTITISRSTCITPDAKHVHNTHTCIYICTLPIKCFITCKIIIIISVDTQDILIACTQWAFVGRLKTKVSPIFCCHTTVVPVYYVGFIDFHNSFLFILVHNTCTDTHQ